MTPSFTEITSRWPACRRRRIVRGVLALVVMYGLAQTQALGQSAPIPMPRPRVLQQGPTVTQPKPPAEIQQRAAPSEPQTEIVPQSPPTDPKLREAWRTVHRACADEWHRMKMAGTTGQLIWPDFYEACRARR